MTPVLAAERSGNFVDVTVHNWQWMVLLGLIVGLLLIDLLVFHREAHEISTKEAAIESAAWISVGVGFMFVVIWWFGGAAGGEYISGYLIEKSLSVDNVFVWALLMAYFLVPRMYQHRVLFWGIFGALVMRAIFIFAGVALIEAFDWILYVFGAFLIFTALRMLFSGEQEVDQQQAHDEAQQDHPLPGMDGDVDEVATALGGEHRCHRGCARSFCWVGAGPGGATGVHPVVAANPPADYLVVLASPPTTAWAAARRAIGTRKGEQLT